MKDGLRSLASALLRQEKANEDAAFRKAQIWEKARLGAAESWGTYTFEDDPLTKDPVEDDDYGLGPEPGAGPLGPEPGAGPGLGR